MKMNHDYAHCADYKYGVCPTECFRGQLVRDLKDAPPWFTVTFMSFKDSKECMLEEKNGEFLNCTKGSNSRSK